MKKQLTALCLVFALLALLTGCGGRTPDRESTAEESVQASSTQAEEAALESAQSYQWDDITFELVKISEDVSTWDGQIEPPEGKYVEVVFKITDGRIEGSRLRDLITEQNCIMLDDYAPASLISQGIRIEDDTAYVTGFIDVFFDVPADYDSGSAVVTVNPAPEAGAAADESAADDIALSEGTSFQWREYSGTVVKTETGGIDNGMFVLQPAEMTEDEYCFDLYLDVDDGLKDSEELRQAFYEASVLTDAQGNRFSPQVSIMPEDGADLLFLYAIPNSVAPEELMLHFAE